MRAPALQAARSTTKYNSPPSHGYIISQILLVISVRILILCAVVLRRILVSAHIALHYCLQQYIEPDVWQYVICDLIV